MAGFVDGLRKLRSAVFGSAAPAVTSEPAHGQKSGEKVKTAVSHQGLNSDPRRYKRAMLLAGANEGVQSKLASASVRFRGELYAVVDLSHAGVAIERAGISDAKLPDAMKPGAQPETLLLTVGTLEPFSVQVTVARHSEKIIAFEFVDVTTDGRLTIDRFLDPKMIGLNTRAVDRAFFAPGETFSIWFCGPRDTNFFLWMNDIRLERAIVQLGDEQFTLAPADGRSGAHVVRQHVPSRATATTADLRDSVLFALDVGLQVKNGGEPIAGLVKLLTEAADALQKGATVAT